MDKRELEIRKKLKNDFPHYSEKCLKIRTKNDGLQPFKLNKAQMYLEERAEAQLKERGYVRILALKGRQQGCSTYIGGRFYHKVTHGKGLRAYILTHESEATASLFEMTARFHQNNNELVKPSTDRDSGKELHFDKLDSGYKVGTAGAQETGRGQTIQYFHGSEVAFWPNAEKHARGVLQAVPKKSGEVWLESTSDGEGNYFYKMWRDAVNGKNDYEAVFIPWMWQEEYVSDVPKHFTRSQDEEEYAEISKREYGLDISNEQLMFRREKISELGSIESFSREYPITAEDAFKSAGVNQLIPSDLIHASLDCKLTSPPIGASILGVDVARFGDDRSVWTHRIGRYMKVLKVVDNATLTEIAGITKMILDSWNYDACFIDMGMGAGVVDMLHEMGYDMVEGVNFGGEPFDKDKYTNKRNEMYGELIEWMKDYPACIDCSQNEKDILLMDLASIQYKFDSKGRRIMEKKEDMKKRTGYSPDIGDSAALTFARPVVKHETSYDNYQPSGRNSKTGY